MLSNKLLLIVLLLIVGISTAYSQRRSVVADVRFHQFKSDVFNNTRTLRVLVPPGYNKYRTRRYQVLYLNDGQNLFQVNTAQTRNSEWGVDETIIDLLEYREIEPIIIVGIDNAGKIGKANEYNPYEDRSIDSKLPNPQGAKYPDFLTNEVIPFIEKKYRVKKGAEHRGLGGSSDAALISLYTVIKKPNTFGRLLLESPSLQVNDGIVFKEAAEMELLPKQIYIGVGTNEEELPKCIFGDQNQEAVQDVLKLKEIFQAKNFDDKTLKVLIEDCAKKSEVAYGRRFYDAMRFFYPRKLR